MDFVRVYDVLTRARERLFEWVRPLSQEKYTQAFPFALRTIRATLIEIAGSEYFYGRRLREEHLPDEDDPISEARQPTFADLERIWTPLAKRTRATLEGITDWDRLVTRRIEEPNKVIVATMTKADVATQ